MKSILIQQRCVQASEDKVWMSASLTQAEKTTMVDKARSVIILCIGGKVLREVVMVKIVVETWVKLESLYMTKSLDYVFFLKQVYSFLYGGE